MMKVTAVEALSDARLHVTLASGKTFNVDVAEYLDAPGYETLRDPALFARVAVEEWGHGVEWPDDIGIPASALYRIAQEQAGKAFPVARFNEWMKRNGLSAAQAARALGLTRRTIIYYHTGAKPIPVVVGLACEGYEARGVGTRRLGRTAWSRRDQCWPVSPRARARTTTATNKGQ